MLECNLRWSIDRRVFDLRDLNVKEERRLVIDIDEQRAPVSWSLTSATRLENRQKQAYRIGLFWYEDSEHVFSAADWRSCCLSFYFFSTASRVWGFRCYKQNQASQINRTRYRAHHEEIAYRTAILLLFFPPFFSYSHSSLLPSFYF